MIGLHRRTVLIGIAAGASAALLGGNGWAPAEAAPAIEGSPGNPHGVRGLLYTIVTADMAASLAFYRDAYGYDHVVQGKLGRRPPTVPGVGQAGRRFAVLNFKNTTDHGAIRLLEAPAGAGSNRPLGTPTTEPGIRGITGKTRDYKESLSRLQAAGLKLIAEPNQEVHGDKEWVAFIGIGPSGERLAIPCFVKDGDKVPPWDNGAYLHGPLNYASVACYDRWPLLDFYGRVFETTHTKETSLEAPKLLMLEAMPPESFARFSMIGPGAGVEWWESREERPPGNIHATSLDRTGIAMITLAVNDLDATRRRAQAAGYPILGEGSLPVVGAESVPGFYLRGSQGELLEIVGR
jgi:catechol 2,3-dioxygenase-like lactoylglutathione lyase family enzyme